MIQIKAIFRKARTKQALRLLYGPLGVVQLVEDDAQGALDAALEHFAELARVLDDATAKAIKLDDTGMVEGADPGQSRCDARDGAAAELRNALVSRNDDDEQASAA